MKKLVRIGLAAAIAFAATPAFAQKSIPLVYDKEFVGIDYPAPAFQTVQEAEDCAALPNPFEFSKVAGKKSKKNAQVKDFKDWEKRRSEIIRELYHYEVGEKPAVARENITATLENNTLTVNVTINGETLTLTSKINYPEGDGPFPLMIGASGISLPRDIMNSRPIATMNFNMNQVMAHQQKRGKEPINKLYPELVENGAYAMWPWGISRLIDGLEIIGEASRIDMKHIGVTGCSYAGKMALWSGAFDERIALTIAQEPGGGGAAAWRVSELVDPFRGTQGVEKLGRTDNHWFKESMWDWKNENVTKLPYDHHELCALVCPRALLVLGNTDFEWLVDEAGYVSSVAARKVWEKFGIEDRMGYSIQGGHGHCQLPKSQYPEVEAFIDKFLLGKEADTDVRHIDQKIKDNMANFGLTVEQFIPWADPTSCMAKD